MCGNDGTIEQVDMTGNIDQVSSHPLLQQCSVSSLNTPDANTSSASNFCVFIFGKKIQWLVCTCRDSQRKSKKIHRRLQYSDWSRFQLAQLTRVREIRQGVTAQREHPPRRGAHRNRQ